MAAVVRSGSARMPVPTDVLCPFSQAVLWMTSTGRSVRAVWISSIRAPATTMTGSNPAASAVWAAWWINALPFQGSSSLGWPMREAAPAARIMPATEGTIFCWLSIRNSSQKIFLRVWSTGQYASICVGIHPNTLSNLPAIRPSGQKYGFSLCIRNKNHPFEQTITNWFILYWNRLLIIWVSRV